MEEVKMWDENISYNVKEDDAEDFKKSVMNQKFLNWKC